MNLTRCPECQALGGHLADCAQAAPVFKRDLFLPENLVPVPAEQRRYFFDCPKCGNDATFTKPGAWAIGPDLFRMFVAAAHSSFVPTRFRYDRVTCLKCDERFQAPPLPNSPAAKLAGWIIILVCACLFCALLCIVTPAIEEMLPALPGVQAIQDLIIQQPRTASYLLTGLVLSTLPLCIIASVISNVRYRRLLSRRYLLVPPPRPEITARLTPAEIAERK